jgi:hypothetical protein
MPFRKSARSHRNLVGLMLAGAAALPLTALAPTATVAAPKTVPTVAVRATDFLDSIGANSALDRRGEDIQHTMDCAAYVGIRWFRAGVEGDPDIPQLIEMHRKTGVRYSWGLGSGGVDLPKVIRTARQLADAGALLAFEGPNEPNNWGVTYQGQTGGGHSVDGKAPSWMAVAKLQSDLYSAVKSDPVLKKYPVWGISENGAETDNVGLQYLTIPPGAKTLMPDGTHFADYANVHNYIYHPNSPGLGDNKTWDAADPGPACKVDGLYGEYGKTWAGHFPGYSPAELLTLPRVTTETGTTIGGVVTEDIHALNLLSLYLDQYKRGWSFTSLYLLRDRVDEAGNQQFGFYRPDYTPRKAAVYLHNLTTVLADKGTLSKPGHLDYAIADEPVTVHDMLLEKSDGTFDLIVWDEQLSGTSTVTVDLGGSHKHVTVYDPTVGTDPTQTLKDTKSLTLTLSDHPLIVAVPRS